MEFGSHRCRKCGNCCRVNGEYAYVYVTSQEADGIIKHLGLPAGEFRRKYTIRLDGRTILRFVDDHCPFLEEKGCAVYGVRPTQCRTWPFWEENVNRKTWNKDVLSICPGAEAVS